MILVLLADFDFVVAISPHRLHTHADVHRGGGVVLLTGIELALLHLRASDHRYYYILWVPDTNTFHRHNHHHASAMHVVYQVMKMARMYHTFPRDHADHVASLLHAGVVLPVIDARVLLLSQSVAVPQSPTLGSAVMPLHDLRTCQ